VKRTLASRFIYTAAVLLLAALAACNGPEATTPQLTGTALPDPTRLLPSPTPTQAAVEDQARSSTLVIWVAPWLNPDLGEPAGEYLLQRLDEYASLHTDTRLEVRVKSVEGPGGLFDSLAAANSAAPAAVPDLVFLPRHLLEAAALKGLLTPFANLDPEYATGAWFPYGEELARLGDSLFGLPFAGDTLVMVYRTSQVEELPSDLPAMLSAGMLPVFAVSDPQAALALHLYLAQGGAVQDAQGRPQIDSQVLAEVLAFYQQAQASGENFERLENLRSNDQALNLFIDSNAPLAILPLSMYFDNSARLPVDTTIAPAPTLNSEPYSSATGWVLALASTSPERQVMATGLAQFLLEPAYLGEWSLAAGSLPAHPAALGAWESTPHQVTIRRIAENARLAPSSTIITILAPVFHQAVLNVLDGQDPAAVAEQAAELLR
jgi:ABC-type glycerol-3-phosphate transport system substrate-binding protein